jgi:pimeloyl-ACP methyl ester carboxylesterase
MKNIISAIVLLFITVQTYALNPSREYKIKPEKYGMGYKEEKIGTKDGALLNAWFFVVPGKHVTNWIVMSGSGDGNMADDLELASQFLSAGWNVCMYDYRGYGSSSEFAIDPDTYIYPQFATDLNAVLDYLRKTRAITKYDLYGRNIGGGLSIGVGSQRPDTRKVIADGPWTSLEQMKKKLKEKRSKDVVTPFGFDKNNEPLFGCDRNIPHLKFVLVIVSAQDDLINPQDIAQLKCVTSTYIVKSSATNADNFSADKNAYFEKIKAFLAQY